jgi:imidazolonepropionase
MHYQPARKIIDANIPVALASDFNPGSCPSGNMNLIVSLACSQMKMTPEEAINACTLNGAAALELSEHIGSISIGKKANFFITQPMPSLAYLPYSFGSNLIDKVIINGILQ